MINFRLQWSHNMFHYEPRPPASLIAKEKKKITMFSFDFEQNWPFWNKKDGKVCSYSTSQQPQLDVMVVGGIDVWGFIIFWQYRLLLTHLRPCVRLCRSTAERTVQAARCCRMVKTSNRSSLGSAGWRDRPKTSSMLCSTEKVTHTHTDTRTLPISHFISHSLWP